ncbi:hypothetical protein BJV78DRAFT_1259654, partial [Lactifluus subvellereus]
MLLRWSLMVVVVVQGAPSFLFLLPGLQPWRRGRFLVGTLVALRRVRVECSGGDGHHGARASGSLASLVG